MKKFVAIGALVVGGIAFTACSGPSDADGKDAGDCEYNACEVTITYKGRDLNCVSWSGSHGETGLTCDFVEYHNEGR